MTAAHDYRWLPEHQWHVAATLGHVDDLIERVADLLFGYSRPPGPLTLANIADGDRAHVVVIAVEPIPAAVGRLAADAMTQLRAALEHTIFAETEFLAGRTLTAAQAKRIEMPASTTAKDFGDWVKARHKLDLPALREGSPLLDRIRDLQPYQRHRDAHRHPLYVLADHTNMAKHRAPILAVARLGAVKADIPAPELTLAGQGDRPLQPGDILATGPRDKQVPLGIWPTTSIQRPQAGTWHEIIQELGGLEEWVRTTAIPYLITGHRNHQPLPPEYDTTTSSRGGFLETLAHAGQTPAAKRAVKRIQAATAREEIVEVLALHESAVDRDAIAAWIESLDDDQLLDRVKRIAKPAARKDLQAAARALLAEAIRVVEQVG